MVGLRFDPKTPVMTHRAPPTSSSSRSPRRSVPPTPRYCMLDEPTSSLTQYEAQHTHSVWLRELKKKGVIMIFVSHKLEEVMEICDKVTVLRDGQPTSAPAMTKDLHQATEIMQDDDWPRAPIIHYRGRLDAENNPVVFEAQQHLLQELHGIHNLSFSGPSGRDYWASTVWSVPAAAELARTVLGIDKMDSGEVFLNGKPINTRYLCRRACTSTGIGYITENRKEEGLFLDDTV